MEAGWCGLSPWKDICYPSSEAHLDLAHSSGWSVAKDGQVPVYSKCQSSTSLPFSFDSLLASLDRLTLTSNFLFLLSRTLAAVRLLVWSCHFFFLHLSLCQWYQPSTIHLFTPPTNKHLLSCFPAALICAPTSWTQPPAVMHTGKKPSKSV